MKIAFFGSSIVSAYWNGAATYYRGLIRSLHELGHRVVFYESDMYDRQQHSDIPDPPYAKVVIYSSQGMEDVQRCLDEAKSADLIVKASGVGIFDDFLEARVLDLKTPSNIIAFWDVDAPATLDRVIHNPADYFAPLISKYDFIFTYGGGQPVVSAYTKLGAKCCRPVYNALDPTTHYRVGVDRRFSCDLAFCGNRLPDREARVEEFFFEAARKLPNRKFIIGGSGWNDRELPNNVQYVGHVYTRDHNAFNSSPLVVLNVCRDSMARYGFSPPTRVFEAAGAGACLITDHWEGIDTFLEVDEEVLVASSGEEVAEHLERLDPRRARAIGDSGMKRVRGEHTYMQRAEELEEVLDGRSAG